MYSEPESDSHADEFLLDNPRFYYSVQKCLNLVPTLPKEQNRNLVPLETLNLRLIMDRTADNSSARVTGVSAIPMSARKLRTLSVTCFQICKVSVNNGFLFLTAF